MRCGGYLGSTGKRWWFESGRWSLVVGVSFTLGNGFLLGGFVVAGVTAGFAVHEAVRADADVELRLTEAAELLALALGFGALALGAAVFAWAGSG
jgi:hypothetical protein